MMKHKLEIHGSCLDFILFLTISREASTILRHILSMWQSSENASDVVYSYQILSAFCKVTRLWVWGRRGERGGGTSQKHRSAKTKNLILAQPTVASRRFLMTNLLANTKTLEGWRSRIYFGLPCLQRNLTTSTTCFKPRDAWCKRQSIEFNALLFIYFSKFFIP